MTVRFYISASMRAQDISLADLVINLAVPVGIQGTRLLARTLVRMQGPEIAGRVAGLTAMLARGTRSAPANALGLEPLAFLLFAGYFPLSFFSLAFAFSFGSCRIW